MHFTGSSTQVFLGLQIFKQRQSAVYKVDAENPLWLLFPDFLLFQTSMLFSCYVYRMQFLFFILHMQIYLGKSLVLTQSNILACFINSRIKSNYHLFFSFSHQSVLSATTHTCRISEVQRFVYCQFSPHLISAHCDLFL